MDFAVRANHRVKIKENEKRDLDPVSELEKKVIEREGDGDTSCN